MAEAAVQSTPAGQTTSVVKNLTQVRGIGFAAVFVFALSSIALTYSGAIPFSVIAGMVPGGSLFGIISVALVLSLLHAYTYAVIGAAAPRNGADYVVASRVLSPALAFASSWMLVFFTSVAAGLVITYIAQSTLPVIFQVVSLITTNKDLLEYIPLITSPTNIVSIGTLGVVLVFILLILPSRVTHRVLSIGLILTLVAWAVLFFQMGSGQGPAFALGWDKLMGQGSFSNQLIQAANLGMATNPSFGIVALAGMVLSFWIFSGYFNPTLIAGEVQRPEKNLLSGTWLALLVAWAVLVLAVFFVGRLISPEWLSAQSFLSLSAAHDGQAAPSLLLYASILKPSPVLTWLVGIIWVYTFLNLAHTYLYTSSRVIMTWAEDRILPDIFAFIHPRLHSPLIAVLMVSLLAELGVLAASIGGNSGINITSVLFLAITQVLPVSGIMLLPFLKKDWFERSVPLVRRKVGRVPVITIVGGASLLYLAGVIAAVLALPDRWQFSLPSLWVVALMFLMGLVWYYGRRYTLKRRGEDLDAFIKHLPEPK